MSFDRILEKRGKDITLKRIATTVIDDFYQTMSETSTDIQIKAIVGKITLGKDLLVDGYEVDGKVVVYVSTGVDVSQGDSLVIDGSEFKIERISRTDAYIKLEAVPA
ncbi:hypothetical protein Asulf_01530 [Archaeoglobus sulfaticallidus PM70-1]|uniref:Uncharacterized protein n=1 Tax=Archaeoglobus sulfaticallidus PM70-1 TaxID=387631 RepID=N0BEU2_9EURY|nr:hypothetical protein [Archaeoglobus sulfaticallidus]AGK61508.1 hypothetical protein Asulf_01530 [Archaeoglobus sulfaticallidus PM70-1]